MLQQPFEPAALLGKFTIFTHLEAATHHRRQRSSPATCNRNRNGAECVGITQIIFGIAACDCTCEWWGNLRLCEDTRPSPNQRPFPTLSHRINVLTPISYPHVS
jgi:hypothetical protein